jgi:hypothetical protein
MNVLTIMLLAFVAGFLACAMLVAFIVWWSFSDGRVRTGGSLSAIAADSPRPGVGDRAGGSAAQSAESKSYPRTAAPTAIRNCWANPIVARLFAGSRSDDRL